MPPTPGFWGAFFEVFFELCCITAILEFFCLHDGGSDGVRGSQDVPERFYDPPKP